MGFCHRLLFTVYTMAGKFTSCYNAVKAQSHYDAGRALVRDQASTGMNRGPTGMIWCSTGMNRGRPGLHRESIEMFNTYGMNKESPSRTGNERRGTGNNRDCTGNNRDGTLAPPGPKHTPAEPRQRPSGAPVNAGRVSL
ncbi:hypothetical protein DPMN_131591 [Dreissena polymorpha]|uniref:Uncharacterized protein n=1 Tax=Dreissena polymorpha TaxID=45954 RepID=A0A9D4FQU6_DREPO|nr:hypothetical protein DPMN_131591 [Dreissena polymorpha]